MIVEFEELQDGTIEVDAFRPRSIAKLRRLKSGEFTLLSIPAPLSEEELLAIADFIRKDAYQRHEDADIENKAMQYAAMHRGTNESWLVQELLHHIKRLKERLSQEGE